MFGNRLKKKSKKTVKQVVINPIEPFLFNFSNRLSHIIVTPLDTSSAYSSDAVIKAQQSMKITLCKTDHSNTEIYLNSLEDVAKTLLLNSSQPFEFYDDVLLNQQISNIRDVHAKATTAEQKKIIALKLEAQIANVHFDSHSTKVPTTRAEEIVFLERASMFAARLAELNQSIAFEYSNIQDLDTKRTHVKNAKYLMSKFKEKIKSFKDTIKSKAMEKKLLKEIKLAKAQLGLQSTLEGMIFVHSLLAKKYSELQKIHTAKMQDLAKDSKEYQDSTKQLDSVQMEYNRYGESLAAFKEIRALKESKRVAAPDDSLRVTTAKELFERISEMADADGPMAAEVDPISILYIINQLYDFHKHIEVTFKDELASHLKTLDDETLVKLKTFLYQPKFEKIVQSGVWAGQNTELTELAELNHDLDDEAIKNGYMGAAMMLMAIHDSVQNEIFNRMKYNEKSFQYVTHDKFGTYEQNQQYDLMGDAHLTKPTEDIKVLTAFALPIALDIQAQIAKKLQATRVA